MMIHPLPERSFSSSECSIVPLRSIKEVFNEDSIFHQEKFRPTTRIKSIILKALIDKYQRVSNKITRNIFLKWYCNAHPHLLITSINKIITSGGMSQAKVFYKFKILIAKSHQQQQNLKRKIQSINTLKRDTPILGQQAPIQKFVGKECRNEKFHHVKTKQKNNKQSQQNPQILTVKQKNQLNCSILQDISINNIQSENQNLFSTQQLQNMKIARLHNALKDSISLIDPKSGEIPVQLITCTNIFQNQTACLNKMTSKLSGTLQIFRLIEKSRQRVIKGCYRRLTENMLQQDYDKLLMKAKRNLELAQENFLIDTEMQGFIQSYQQQSNHLEKIDKHMESLKQKFLYSRIISLQKILKKIVYAPMRVLYDQFQMNIVDSGMKKEKKVCYQILEIPVVSSTSLSNKSSSFNYIPFFDKQSRNPRKSLQQRLELKDFITYDNYDYDKQSIKSDDSEYSLQ